MRKQRKSAISKDVLIARVVAKFGDRFDLSKFVYKSVSSASTIICLKHGEFEKSLTCLIASKHGCKTCAYEVKYKLRDNFIFRGNKIHNGKYDYSMTVYIRSDVPVIIICPKHGEFKQQPNTHINSGHGCIKCAHDAKRMGLDNFIQEANQKHNGKYNYSLCINYKNNNSKLIIICPTHGNFPQAAAAHLRGQGCPDCKLETLREKFLWSQEKFMEELKTARGEKYNEYDYSLSVYDGADEPIKIICKIHGAFEQTPSCHLGRNYGCPTCYGKPPLLYDDFVLRAREMHGNQYDYSKFVCTNMHTPSTIVCKIHGEFQQSSDSHLRGRGCKDCKFKNEGLVNTFLIDKFKFQRNFHIKINNKNIFSDFYIPKLNLIIEYNGAQHYRPVNFGGLTKYEADENFKKQQVRDQMLRDYCVEKNIELLEIDGRKHYNKGLTRYLEVWYDGLYKNSLAS